MVSGHPPQHLHLGSGLPRLHLFCWCSVPVLLFIAALPLSHFRSHGARSVYNQRAVYCAAISIGGNQETGALKEHPGVKKIQTAYYTGVGEWDSFVDNRYIDQENIARIANAVQVTL